ncbi:MAG TPA: DAK2 domain-containing protein [Streptosporangiaceae bacterium]
MTALAAIDGPAVRRWYRLAADALAQAGPAIDALNVFPVPDADTGTNLTLTLRSAAQAVAGQPGHAGPAQLWQAAAQGALAGACGNSGIIVSQLLRGLADVCGAAQRCDGPVLAAALAHAARLARAAVSEPVEGTVLTVADAAATAAAAALSGPEERGQEVSGPRVSGPQVCAVAPQAGAGQAPGGQASAGQASAGQAGAGQAGAGQAGAGQAGAGTAGAGQAGAGTASAGQAGAGQAGAGQAGAGLAGQPGAELAGVVTAAAAGARAALARTSEQLAVLAASGVVDAGAAGLCVLLDVLAATVTGRPRAEYEVPAPVRPMQAGLPGGAAGTDGAAGRAASGLGPGTGAGPHHYEVTYLLEASAAAVGELRERLGALGDSVVIAGAGQSWHVHVHLGEAGAAVEAGLQAGRPSRITVTYLGPVGPGPGASDQAGLRPGTADLTGCGRDAAQQASPQRSAPAASARADSGRADSGRAAGTAGASAAGASDTEPAGRAVIAVTGPGRTGQGPAGPGPAGMGLAGTGSAGPGPVGAGSAGTGVGALLGAAGARVANGTDAGELIGQARQAGRELILLPDGDMALSAAQEAAARLGAEGRTVAVIGSRSPLQALAAMAVHVPGRPFAADVAGMDRAAAGMRCGSLVRRDGSLTGLVDGAVAVTGTDEIQVAICLAEALMAGGGELVTLMAAGAADSPLPLAVAAHLASRWPAAEVACYGNGPAPLLIGVE